MKGKVYDIFMWFILSISLIGTPLYLALLNYDTWYQIIASAIMPVLILIFLYIILSLIDDYVKKRKDLKSLLESNKEEKSDIKEIMKEYKDYDWTYANGKATYGLYQKKLDMLRSRVITQINSKEHWIERYLKDLKDLIELANNDLGMGVFSDYILEDLYMKFYDAFTDEQLFKDDEDEWNKKLEDIQSEIDKEKMKSESTK